MIKKRFPFSLLLLLGFLVSCQNFLDGTQLKSELSDAITYANLPFATVEIKSDSTATNLIVPPINVYEGKYKKTDTITLRFEPAAGYAFDYWTCEPKNAIFFKDAKELETTAQIVSDDIKIFITPKTFRIPDASVLPDFAYSGVPQDSNIVVTFNTPLSENFFYDVKTDSFKNIQINSASISLFPAEDQFYYFDRPILSEDGFILTIPTNKAHPILTEAGMSKDITVSLLTKNIEVAPGKTFDKNIEWTYRINSDLDKEKPQDVTANIWKNAEQTKELMNQPFSDSWQDELIFNNLTGKTVYVFARGYDAGGGICKVTVKETLIRDNDGNNTENENITASTDYTTLNLTNENNYYSTASAFAHTFKTISDGVIKIEVLLEDYAGNNTSTEPFYVIKDTILKTTDITPKEDGHDILENVYSDDFYYTKNSVTKCLRYALIDDSFIRPVDGDSDTFTLNVSDIKETIYCGKKATVTVTEVLYGESAEENAMKKAAFLPEESVFTFQRDRNKNTFMLIKAQDAAGNSSFILRVIPHAVDPTGLSREALYDGGALKKFPSAYFPYMTVKTTSYQDYAKYGEENGVLCVFINADGKYCVFPDVLRNIPDPKSCQFSFNPTTHDYYSKGTTIDGSNDLCCHTGPSNEKKLAEEEDYSAFMPSGDYEIYIVPYIKYSEKTYFGGRSNPLVVSVSNDDINIEFKPLDGETYQVSPNRWKVKNESDSATDIFPDQSSVQFEIQPGAKSSGEFFATVSFEGKEGYSYSLEARTYLQSNGKVNTQIFSTGKQISLSINDTYKIFLRATDGKGKYSLSTYSWDAVYEGEENEAPVFSFENVYTGNTSSRTKASNYTTPNAFRLFNVNGYYKTTLLPTDKSGLKTDENGSAFINYYFIPVSEGSSARAYTAGELESYKKQTLTFDPSDMYNESEVLDYLLKYNLYYDGLDEGYYELYMIAEDIYGNSADAYGIICNKLRSVDFNYSYVSSSSSSKLKYTGTQDLGYNMAEYISEDGSWKEILKKTTTENGSTYNWSAAEYRGLLHYTYQSIKGAPPSTTKDTDGEIVLNEASGKGSRFIKLNTNSGGLCSYTQYILPDYYKSAETYPCDKKNIISSSSTTPVLSILCDSPTLVHTFCCSKNFSETAGTDDPARIAEIWYSKGIEVTDSGAIMQKSSDFSYKVPVGSGMIKKGMWYTTIVHFADGDVLMTEPKQK
ncbi:hypothetical protein [Treponema sp.]|uniref:hypothetical protein n=1 Tax=Treponema sp. TaxID=166 RepID=UPI00298D6930|nr:hypothetical protein [Treponema sp.]MCQ2240999.1 hypothetical protein [Treponema sp.]